MPRRVHIAIPKTLSENLWRRFHINRIEYLRHVDRRHECQKTNIGQRTLPCKQIQKEAAPASTIIVTSDC